MRRPRNGSLIKFLRRRRARRTAMVEVVKALDDTLDLLAWLAPGAKDEIHDLAVLVTSLRYAYDVKSVGQRLHRKVVTA